MPRLTVTQRLRGTLRRLIRDGGWGTAASLAKYSQDSPGGSKLSAQNITYFLNQTPGRPHPITLDDLDDIAAFFRVSIGELTGTAKPGDLTGDEQRLVYAFRVLPLASRDHFLGIIEQMSGYMLAVQKRRLHLPDEPAQNADSSRSEAPHGPAVHAETPLSLINHAMLLLADAATLSVPDRSISGAAVAKPAKGSMAR